MDSSGQRPKGKGVEVVESWTSPRADCKHPELLDTSKERDDGTSESQKYRVERRNEGASGVAKRQCLPVASTRNPECLRHVRRATALENSCLAPGWSRGLLNRY